ncbi:L-type lectin-like domain-containing protein [Entamoeba marina]
MLIVVLCFIVYSLAAFKIPYKKDRGHFKWLKHINDQTDTEKSLLSESSNYVFDGFKSTESGWLLQNKVGVITSNFKLSTKHLSLVVPMQLQIQNKPIHFILSQEPIHDINNLNEGVNGIKLTMDLSRSVKNQILLTTFNTKETRINRNHELTCRGKKQFTKHTAISLSYSSQTETLSTSFYLDEDLIKCSNENFIKLPKEVYLTVIMETEGSVISQINVLMSNEPKKTKKHEKKYTLQEIQNKEMREMMMEMYEGLDGAYDPLFESNQLYTTTTQQIKNIKHYIKETVIPKCGDLETQIDITPINKNIDEIQMKPTIETISKLISIEDVNHLQLENKKQQPTFVWALVILLQLITISILYLTIRRKRVIIQNN